mgnify:CR=1 FL=1|jgi:hypothetical protein
MAILEIKEGDTVWVLPSEEMGVTQRIKGKIIRISEFNLEFPYTVVLDKELLPNHNREWDLYGESLQAILKPDEIYKTNFSNNKFV